MFERGMVGCVVGLMFAPPSPQRIGRQGAELHRRQLDAEITRMDIREMHHDELRTSKSRMLMRWFSLERS